jgi:hypothetical protein
MKKQTTHPIQDRHELVIPGHLARYDAEVETWRREARAYRASRAAEEAHR